MAAPPMPQRKSSGSGAMSNPSGSVLDGPPPSPAFPQGQQVQPGEAQLPSFAQMSQPLTPGSPTAATSPEVLQGVSAGMASIEAMWDSMAGVVPAFAADFAMLKDMQQRLMAKLAVQGAQPMANALGNNFPGGGFDRGAM